MDPIPLGVPHDWGNSSLSIQLNATGGNGWVAVFLCLIIIITTAGNFILILLIFSQDNLRSTSNYFLVSLFMSDLMVGLVVMPPAMLNELYGRWVLLRGFCLIWVSFDVMCCSASILNLCVISLDRYLLITSPLQYKLHMTPGRALLLILAAWTLAALASFLPIEMGWHEPGLELPSAVQTSAGEDDEQCRLLVSLPFALIASCLTFFLPSVAISFTYWRILRAARSAARRVASLPSTVAEQGQASKITSQFTCESRRLANTHSRKALKASLTLGVLLGMFFAAWLPFFVANMVQAVCDCVPGVLFNVLTWLGYCNSTMNPIIYPLFMRDFKRAMAHYMPCCPRARERHHSMMSLSMKNSNSGRALKSTVVVPGDTESLNSDPTTLRPTNKELVATGADSVKLIDLECTAHELLPCQLMDLE